ncbi:MAG: DUF3465 domain-containing protein [Vulcanimicrobiaceae bacterium]
MPKSLALLGWSILACALAACSSSGNSDICKAYALHRSRVETTASGTLVRILRQSDGQFGPHAQFLVRLNSSCALTVRIAANERFTGPLPLRVGEGVRVHGEYEYYRRGGVIHWTHRDPRGHHDSGFVELSGRLYE